MIVITAPTGNIGRALLSRLLESAPAKGEELRVIVRDPARLPEAARDRAGVFTDTVDPETSSPTTFEQWCAQTLKPAVEAF